MERPLISHMIHTCVVCSDFERSLDFYTRVLGASVGGRVSSGEAGPLSAAMGAPGARRWRGAMLYWGERSRTSYLDLIAYERDEEQAGAGPCGDERAGAGPCGDEQAGVGPCGDERPGGGLRHGERRFQPSRRSATEPGLARLCLRVADVERVAERLREHGVDVLGPPTEIEIEGRIHRVLFFLDPDGTLLELSERTVTVE